MSWIRARMLAGVTTSSQRVGGIQTPGVIGHKKRPTNFKNTSQSAIINITKQQTLYTKCKTLTLFSFGIYMTVLKNWSPL